MLPTEDERGITPVLGAILVVGISLTAFALWFGALVPEWQESREASHMDSVRDSLVSVKGSIEGFVRTRLFEEAMSEAGVEGFRSGYSTTVDVKLNSEPLPLLGWMSTGTLQIAEDRIRFESNNSYYPSQNFVYKNGAVILVQDKKSVVSSSPSMITTYERPGENIEVWVTLVSLNVSGENAVGGSGSVTLELELDNITYRSENRENVELTMNNNHLAWHDYFMDKSEYLAGKFGENISTVWMDNNADTTGLVITGKDPDKKDIFYWERHVSISVNIVK